jgi:hypothetical protein
LHCEGAGSLCITTPSLSPLVATPMFFKYPKHRGSSICTRNVPAITARQLTTPRRRMARYKALGDHSSAAITRVWQQTGTAPSTQTPGDGSHRTETGPSRSSVYPWRLKVSLAKSAHP